jgi:uncharacterized membrane protein YbhN (UPF0104 family)
MRNLARITFQVLKIAIGILLLVISLRNIQWYELGNVLSVVQIGWLILAVISVVIGLALKALRWGVLLSNFGLPAPVEQICSAYFLGQAANIVLPVRGGELVRLGWLRSQQKRGAGEIITTIGLEKYLDLVMLVLLTIWMASNLPDDLDLNKAWIAPLSIAVTLGLAAGVVWGPLLWRRWKPSLEQRLPAGLQRFVRAIDGVVEGSVWLRHPGRMLPMAGLTIAIWLVMGATNLLLMQAFGIPADIRAAVLVLLMIYVGMLPALMPGNIGPFLFFATLALGVFGVEEQTKIGFALLLHAIVNLPPLIIAGGLMLISRRRG